MLPEELIDLAENIIKNKCESQHIELKTAAGGTPERLYDTLSSFTNQTGGGIIIFGIDEKHDFAVTGVYDAQDLQTRVTNQALQMEPVVRPVFTVARLSEHIIVSAEISECDIYDKPCFYKGAGRLRGSFIRVGEADMPMTEYEVYSYEAFKRNVSAELETVERSDMDSFDKDAMSEYFIRLRSSKPNLRSLPDERVLKLQGITDGIKPTVAGIMMLGEYPQAYFPQLSITAMLVDGFQIGDSGSNSERFIDNRRIEGTIPQMLDSALAFVRRNMRTSTVIDADGKRADRPEYPIIAVRELVLNALIHRDYSIHTVNSPIRIIIYKDRLEIENPGGLYGRLTVDELGRMPADTRNPFIAGGLEVLLNTENRFSGIPTVMHELKKSGLPPAVFESRRGTFKVTLYNRCCDSFVNEDDYAYGYSFIQPVNNDTEYRILSYCNEPRTRAEIARLLDIGTATYAASRYITPLVTAGKLKLTLPDTPKSKNQRYVTVR